MNVKDEATRVQDASGELFQQVDTLTKRAMIDNNSTNPSSNIYLALNSAVVGLRLAAILLGNHGDYNRERDDDATFDAAVDRAVNPVSLLVAALTLARSAKPIPDGVKMDFSPAQIVAAMAAAEKILGVPIEPHLDPNMVKAVRRQAETPAPWDVVTQPQEDAERPRFLN